MKKLIVIKEPTVTERIMARLDAHRETARTDIVEALSEAERLRAAFPHKRYMVNYRVDSEDTSVRGKRAERYSALMKLIQGLAGEHHMATSAWIVTSRQPGAKSILDRLSGVLDEKLDFLSVTEIAHAPAAFGNARLKSGGATV